MKNRLIHWWKLWCIENERRSIRTTQLHFIRMRDEVDRGEAWCAYRLAQLEEAEVMERVRARRWQQYSITTKETT